jgi:hypothetical protein
MRKRKRLRFVKGVKELLLSLGAEEHDDDQFVLQTKAGRLTLHPVENVGIEGPGTVFGCFDDPKAARQFVDCNPSSGKWNHHYFGGTTMEAALADLEFQLRRVVP